MRYTGAALAVLLLILAVSCAEEAKQEPLLRIEEQELSVNDFIEYMSEVHPEVKAPIEEEVLQTFLQEFEERKLLAYGAALAGVVPPRDADTEIGRESGMIARFLTEEANRSGALEISEESILELYRKRYGEPRVRIRSIFFDDEATARRVHNTVRRYPDRFERYMQEHNTERITAEGIGQGVMTRHNMPEWLSEKVFAIREGRVSELINFGDGYVIVQVQEYLSPQPLDEVRSILYDELAAVMRVETRRSIATGLRSQLEIEFNPQLVVAILTDSKDKEERQQ